MPGPMAEPKPAEKYREDVRKSRKRGQTIPARLKARQDDYDNFIGKANAFPGEYHKPGSQNRNK